MDETNGETMAALTPDGPKGASVRTYHMNRA